MATNLSANNDFINLHIAPSPEYPFGSVKDDSTGLAGDGTPVDSYLLNDILGLLQWLLSRANIVPSGSADTATVSQYGAALTALIESASLGVDQTWQDVSASRTLGVPVQNTEGKPIMISVGLEDSRGDHPDFSGLIRVTIDGLIVTDYGSSDSQTLIVPKDSFYTIDAIDPVNDQISYWNELK